MCYYHQLSSHIMETEKHELKRVDVCLICTDSAAIVVSLCCESEGKKNLHKTCLSVRVRNEGANERTTIRASTLWFYPIFRLFF